MSSILLLLYPESAKSQQIIIVLTSLMPVIVVGMIVYFGTLFLIDQKSREMFKTILRQFLAKKLG
jgi:phage shock protein PspC (stress-responsive transcriptional regulator)